MIDPQREPLGGVVEVDQTEIPFRADNSFFDPVKSGKMLIAGAVEVIDRGTNRAKPRRKRAKYLDTRSGRIRLAAIPDNSAASIEAFVRANVKTGTTLLTDGHRLTQLGLDRADDAAGDLVMQLENVLERAVETACPNMRASRRVDQLAGDAHAAP